MSHTLYNIEGIILSSVSVSESSAILSILTSNLGLIRVWAQGVRRVESKLAPHVQDLTGTRLVIIRGREYWRLIDAEKKEDYTALLQNKTARSLIIRLIQMLKRIAHEDVDDDVYALTYDLLQRLRHKENSHEELRALEIIFMLRLLDALGYGDEEHAMLLKNRSTIYDEDIDFVTRNKVALTRTINESLKESQL